MGIRKVTLDVDPATLPNLVPVDEVIRAAMALSERKSEGPRVEVLHAANPHRRTTGEHLEIMGRRLGIQVATGKSDAPWDRQFNDAIAWNREFASTTWEFDVANMRRAAGESYCARGLTVTEMDRIVDAYLREVALREPNTGAPAALTRAADATADEAATPKSAR
jgi:hypothetical protein